MLKQKLNLLENKIDKTIEVTSKSKDFLSRTLMALEIVMRISKWDHNKLKCSCIMKDKPTGCKNDPQNGRKKFASYYPDRELHTA